MTDAEIAVLITLIAYKVVLLGIGYISSLRTHSEADFFLAGRALGPLVAAISASASSSSVWTLLGVSGFAYKFGLSALWLFPSCVGGFLINWFLIGPRLRVHSARTGAITLTDVIAGEGERPGNRAIRWVVTIIILLCLMTYVASQFEGAGKTFAETFDMSKTWSILLGSTIVVIYTLLGGFWAVSLTDTLQGLLMAATAAVLPVFALIELGGFGELWQGIQAVEVPGYTSLIGDRASLAAGIGFVLGLFGIGMGYPGQP
ncbi:MAG: sodium:solute symporter family transporter, partial [Planctomycetota bacterium]